MNGYDFHTGEEHKMNGTLRKYPAAWLLPPTTKSKTGRVEGEIVYHITLHLATLPSPASTAAENSLNIETLWTLLERDVAMICAAIAEEADVCALSNVSYTPACGSLTSHGEVALTVEADISIWYYI